MSFESEGGEFRLVCDPKSLLCEWARAGGSVGSPVQVLSVWAAGAAAARHCSSACTQHQLLLGRLLALQICLACSWTGARRLWEVSPPLTCAGRLPPGLR